MLVLFGVALLVRAVVLVQMAATPYFEVANIDSVAYQQWAARITGGAWVPAGTFYQSPLYAYFLAVLSLLAGPSTWSPRLVQIVVGSVNPVLLYLIGARLFSRRVGWIAGLVLALYGPIVLEEVTLSKTTLLVATSLAGFGLYLRGAPSGRLRDLLAAGVLFGVSVVGVGQWLLVFLGLAAWTPMMASSLAPAARRRALGAFLGGGLVLILPMVVWNSARGGGLILTSADAGLNLFTGNNERATGLPASPVGLRDTPQFEEADARRLAEQAVGHPLAPAQVARYWSGRALAWITAHPAAWLTLLGMKFSTLWNGAEIPDNYHYVFMRTYFLPSLRLLVTFSVVAPLALLGAVMPFWRRRDVTALYIACFGYLTTILMFYVRGRYRLQALPLLIVLAAVGVDRLLRAASARRWPAVAALSAGLAIAVVFTNREYCEPGHHGMQPVCLGGDTWFDGEWLKLAEWYRNARQLDRAIVYAERAQECTRPRSVGSNLSWLAELETMRTEELLRAGQGDAAAAHLTRAERHYRAALAIGYRPGPTQRNLGSLYSIAGKQAEAVTALEAAAAANALDVAAARRLATAYVAVGRCTDARRGLERLDRANGVPPPSDEARLILAPCEGRP
jgi:tetratricopeptide (TPR) repeat protein